MLGIPKMRRRLTVTGASETIDGVSRLSMSDLRNDDTITKFHSAFTCAVTDYSGSSKKGYAPYNPRKKNQDALIMMDDISTNSLILCVLDGHGENGDSVANEFRDRLPSEITNHPSWKNDIKKATSESITKIEQDIIQNFKVDTDYSGTTLAMAVIRGNHVTCINIGDSRIILGKEQNKQFVSEELTIDHKPDLPKEKERILSTGGRVFAVAYDDGIDGPVRVWLADVDIPGLAMSRSLGDTVAHTAGVSSEPEFSERTLNPEEDRFIIVATDGLWEFVSSKETTDIVSMSSSPSDAVEALVRESNIRWMKEEQVIDDTTIIAAYLFNY